MNGAAAETGKPVWHYAAGGDIVDAPMSYSVDGKQYTAIGAGNVLYSSPFCPDKRYGSAFAARASSSPVSPVCAVTFASGSSASQQLAETQAAAAMQ